MTKRRNFIKQIAGAGLLGGLAPLKALAEMSPENGVVVAGKSETESGTLRILQTTDVHCQLHPHDELFWENNRSVYRKTGGYAHIATAFKQLKKGHPDTFILDTGDMFQGSELSVKTTGKAIAPVLNELGYNLYLPGNWEVIYAKHNMQTLMGGLHAPKICANMFHDTGEGKKGELIFPAYHTWFAKGVKIGFLGYTDPLVPVRQSPAYSKGIIYTKPEENIRYYIDVLKRQEQCDMIIILSHLGLSQQIALANSPECEGVDYIFGGDTHERVRKPIQCQYAKVVEPGAFGSFIGKLDIEVKQGKISGHSYELIEVNPNTYKADKDIARLIEQEESSFKEEMSRIIGYSSIPLSRYFVVENSIDTLVTDALLWKTGTDIALSNGFRFCPPLVPGKDGKAAITESFLYDMLPVDSNVRRGEASGQQILDWLEKELNNVFAKDASKRLGGWVVRTKGLNFEFHAFKEAGKRINRETINVHGEPLNPDKIYSICACEREGDPSDMLCRMQKVKNTVNTGDTLHSCIRAYLKQFSPVAPVPRGNVKILDAPQTLLSQVYGVDYEFR